jgi:hypothetical protein
MAMSAEVPSELFLTELRDFFLPPASIQSGRQTEQTVRSDSLLEERRFEPAVRFQGEQKKISKAHRQFESLSL